MTPCAAQSRKMIGILERTIGKTNRIVCALEDRNTMALHLSWIWSTHVNDRSLKVSLSSAAAEEYKPFSASEIEWTVSQTEISQSPSALTDFPMLISVPHLPSCRQYLETICVMTRRRLRNPDRESIWPPCPLDIALSPQQLHAANLALVLR